MAVTPLIQSEMDGSLKLLARGKVRDLYEIDKETLLFVATDPISAYDVIMGNGIPGKGALLTLLSAHCLTCLKVPQHLHARLQNRSMQVRKLKIFPIEAIVRGNITGSAWKEYQTKGTVHGMLMKPGMEESEAFPQNAIYTPSTKAEAGQNDENIHPDEAARIVGEKYAKRIEDLALKLYTTAHAYALERGIIIADTKFEFGLDKETNEVVLVDEVLTADSSRFWPASCYKVGQPQDSFDKQYLRDWLTANGLKGKLGVDMPEDVVRNTGEKYKEAFERLVGRKWDDA